MTLGGNVRESLAWHGDPGLATAIAWHLAGMWLLGASFLTCVLWGVFSGHFWRDFMPVGPVSFFRDFIASARFQPAHTRGQYNAVQKGFYWGVMALIVIMIVSGVAIWKPDQTYPLEALFGGYPTASRAFPGGVMNCRLSVCVYRVPSTLIAMVVGQFGKEPVVHRVVPAQTHGDVP